ncbi:ROK family protein [Streptomyces sp. NPDC002746]
MKESALNGGDPALLRRLNIEAVLRAIRDQEPMTLAQIGKAASLSRQTVDVALEELAGYGWIDEVAPSKSKGRPARRYRFRADAGHVLGIDVGSHSALLILADLDGNLVSTLTVNDRDPDQPSSRSRLETIRNAAIDFVAEHPVKQITAVCLGVPGIVDAAGQIRASTPLSEWQGLDLAREAGRWFGCPAYVENDANLAAVAEHWRGAAQDTGDFIQLLTGRRTGAALILNGQLHRGRGGAAGEIAGLHIFGWDGTDLTALGGSDTGQVFVAAAEGEQDAVDRVERFARTYAQGTAAMVLTVNPDLVVIGGGISRAGESLAAPMRRHLEELCVDPPLVRASELGVEAVALGAVRHALNHTDQNLFNFHSPKT